MWQHERVRVGVHRGPVVDLRERRHIERRVLRLERRQLPFPVPEEARLTAAEQRHRRVVVGESRGGADLRQ
jgi:hypothetical protein